MTELVSRTWFTRGSLWLLAVGIFALAAVAFPTFRAPDEPAHVDRVFSIQQDPAAAFDQLRPLSEQVRMGSIALGLTGSPSGLPPLPSGSVDDRAFDEVAPDGTPSDLRNQMTQHPPLYYGLAALWTTTLQALDSGRTSMAGVVLGMRLLGVALLASLPALSVVAARRAGLDRASAYSAGIIVLGVPMLAHIAGSVSNDTLLTLLGAVLTLQLVAVVREEPADRPWWARPVAIGAIAALALLTKGFGLIVLGWIPLTLLLAPISWSRKLRELGLIVLTSGIGLAWWIRNLVVEGTIQPDHASLPVATADFVPDAAWWIPFAARRLVQRFWVEPDVAQDVALTGMAAAGILIVLVAVGSVVMLHRQEHAVLAVLAFPLVGTLGIMIVGAWQLYVRTGAPFGIHGRYLYPALPAIAIVAAAAMTSVPIRHRRLAIGALLLAALTYQSRVMLAALTFYWGDERRGPVSAALAAAADWAPTPPLAIVAMGALALLGLMGTALSVWSLREPDQRMVRDTAS